MQKAVSIIFIVVVSVIMGFMLGYNVCDGQKTNTSVKETKNEINFSR